MKSLWARTRKSTRAVVQAPASVVVGMRYSSVVSRVMAGMRYFSSTLSRAGVGNLKFSKLHRSTCLHQTILTMVLQLVTHQGPGFLQASNSLLVLIASIFYGKQKHSFKFTPNLFLLDMMFVIPMVSLSRNSLTD